MMLRHALFVILLMVMIGGQDANALLTTAKVTIKVVGEDGLPIEGAEIGVGFEENAGWAIRDVDGQRGLSDAEGKFVATGHGNGHVSYGANKEGYYHSYYVYDFQKLATFGWEPYNPELTVVLRKIGNPVPMYARDIRKSLIEIPVADKDVGFDLIKFDWVVPYGTGTHSDFIFHLKRRVVDRKDFDATLTLSFSNRNDGIQPYYEGFQYGSEFKLPRYAPENGYRNTLVFHEWRTPNDGRVQRNFDFVKKDLNYIFRVRSKEEDGKVVEAMYGKILRFMDFSAIRNPTAKIAFKYYLNPDGTRNLEFDPKRNLFTGLSFREWVEIK